MKGGKKFDLKKALKTKPRGVEVPDLIKMRTRIQIDAPGRDDLTRPLFAGLRAILPTLSGSFLDVGCYGGWLYHYVGNQVDYHGIDNWFEAIQAARELFPPERFSCEDMFSSQRSADTVWGTQLHPELDVAVFLPRLAAMAGKRVFFTQGRSDYTLQRDLFRDVIDHRGILEGVKW